MKHQTMCAPASSKGVSAKTTAAPSRWLIAVFVLVLTVLTLPVSSLADGFAGIRFGFTQERFTVPVNSTNFFFASIPSTNTFNNNLSTNNSVVGVNGATNLTLSLNLSGLPAGVSVYMADQNTNLFSGTSNGSTNIALVVNATNVPQGSYVFWLNAFGFDSNSVPISNSMPFVVQSAHLWVGGLNPSNTWFGISNNWATATNWAASALPGTADDVVFGDSGSQTNITFSTGIPYTNITLTATTTVGSVRFAMGTYVNTNILATNAEYYTFWLTNASLQVFGSNGMSFLRDYTYEVAGFYPDSTMGVFFSGTNSSLNVLNTNANFSTLIGNGQQPTLCMSNLGTFYLTANRIGFSDYELFPNYRALNNAYNAGRDTNQYGAHPSHFWGNVFLARTNFITAYYVDPNNYTNEYTRDYSLMVQNNEQNGNGSGTSTFFSLGLTNAFYMDSICFIGSSSASGNNGGTRYMQMYGKGVTNGTIFRAADGVSRMSMFAVSDDACGTNEASSNVKATVDFSGGSQGYVNLLADRLYIARDRTLISSNQSPNVQGDLVFGNGTVDVNTMFLGCQEHSNKVDWTTLYQSAGDQPYLNYCQGRLAVTNGGLIPSVVKVNGTLTLGYTADQNPATSAEQYFTYGQVTIYSNATLQVSNVICDGGLNYYDNIKKRNNQITMFQGGNLIITNAIGYPNNGANDFSAGDPRGMWLDSLNMTAAKLTIFADPSKVNVYVRNLQTLGVIPSIIKVAALSNVSSYPVQFPVITYPPTASATPFMNADVSALGTNYFGYVLNDAGNHSVDLFITTNSPNNLTWTGNQNSHWNTTDLNWVLTGTSTVTNFNLGDIVTFNDSSTITNVNIDGSVVPGQTGVGMTISNTAYAYVFSGGTVAGTALVSKLGTAPVEFDATEQGPINITAGTMIGNGQLGTTTVYTNVVLNYAGSINGGLTSTGIVVLAAGSSENGPVNLQGGWLQNAGQIQTLINGVITMAQGVNITNTSSGLIGVGAGAPNSGLTWDVPTGSTLANFNEIDLYQPRINVEGLLYGNGLIKDMNGGGHASIANTANSRVVIQSGGIISAGLTPNGSISSMSLQSRFDLNNDPSSTGNGFQPGIVRVELDMSTTNYDVYNIDRWNNVIGIMLMTNIGGGSFSSGQSFQVFNNGNSGDPYNFVDTLGYYPIVQPYLPGPGLQWGMTNFTPHGIIAVTNTPMVWVGGNGNWNTNGLDANWKSGNTFADNQGAWFDDTATGTTTVSLNSTVAPDGVLLYTNISGGTTNVFTNQPSFVPGIVFNNSSKNYILTGTGKITGMTGLYKTGTGTVTMMASNDYTGDTIIDNGTLAITNQGGIATIVSLGVAGTGQIRNEVIIDGGTLSYVGLTNVNLGHFVEPLNGGATINVASFTNTLNANNNVVGFGSLTKTGPGTLQLSSGANNYGGNTVINGGTVWMNGPNASTNAITLNNTSALQLTNNFTLTNTLNLNGPALSIQIIAPSTNIWSGNWTGSGFVTFSNNNPLTLVGDISGFSGTVSFGTTSGTYQFNNKTNSNLTLGSTAATFDLGTGSSVLENFNGSNLTYNLGALSGGPNTVLTGRSSTNSTSPNGETYSIGANGSTTTFAGKITNGIAYNGVGTDPVAIVKTGSGTLFLNGVSTYSGTTTVNSGGLAGTGSIASPLTVSGGGTLSAGTNASSTGLFTISNSVTLGGTTLLKLNQALTPANDQIAVTGTLTGGGALVVTNVGATLVNGSTFQLFSKAVTGFSSITLPTNGTPIYVWTTNLTSNGSITLVSGGAAGVNTGPTNIIATVSGNTLTLQWPPDHTGWRLLSQTNPLSVGLTQSTNNWFYVNGSSSTNKVIVNLVPSNPTVFYRLIYP